MTRQAFFGLAAGCLLAWVGLQAAGDTPKGEDGVKADWEKVRGKWERVFKDKEGKTIRTTKEIRGNQETITDYNDKGEVIYSHVVEVKLERVGKFRVFSFSKGKVLAGPNKGQEFSQERNSYVYTTDGQTFVEVPGLAVGEEEFLTKGQPQVAIWKRVKE